MRFRLALSVSLLVTLPLLLFGQDEDDLWRRVDSIQSIRAEQDLLSGFTPWSYSTSVGTTFAFIPSYGSFMSTYLAPQINYQVTNRLAFHSGILGARTAILPGKIVMEDVQEASIYSLSMYVAASYWLTEGLAIHGTAIKIVANTPFPVINPYINYRDLSIGATYDFGNFSIGASFHRSNSNQFNSPMGITRFGSPFTW